VQCTSTSASSGLASSSKLLWTVGWSRAPGAVQPAIALLGSWAGFQQHRGVAGPAAASCRGGHSGEMRLPARMPAALQRQLSAATAAGTQA
jgi:hypothetical protein